MDTIHLAFANSSSYVAISGSVILRRKAQKIEYGRSDLRRRDQSAVARRLRSAGRRWSRPAGEPQRGQRPPDARGTPQADRLDDEKKSYFRSWERVGSGHEYACARWTRCPARTSKVQRSVATPTASSPIWSCARATLAQMTNTLSRPRHVSIDEPRTVGRQRPPSRNEPFVEPFGQGFVAVALA
ncbi:MAG: hypothetical protein JWQ95_2433 [Sphaerisporangium sp.]|nr:hypothetical protein [Sphaerisporangium sp.]